MFKFVLELDEKLEKMEEEEEEEEEKRDESVDLSFEAEVEVGDRRTFSGPVSFESKSMIERSPGLST